MIADCLKNMNKDESSIHILSNHNSLMGTKAIPTGKDYFLIKFFARLGSDECEIARTRIVTEEFTPTTRLDIVAELNKYKKALPQFNVSSRFAEYEEGEEESKDHVFINGLPMGRF